MRQYKLTLSTTQPLSCSYHSFNATTIQSRHSNDQPCCDGGVPVPHRTALDSSVLYCTILHSTVLCCAVLYWTAQLSPSTTSHTGLLTTAAALSHIHRCCWTASVTKKQHYMYSTKPQQQYTRHYAPAHTGHTLHLSSTLLPMIWTGTRHTIIQWWIMNE